MGQDGTPLASPSTSSASQSSPGPSTPRTGVIAHLTGLASAIAAISFAGPIATDAAAPTWMRASAMAIVGLTVLPPGISLALVGNAAGILSTLTKRNP